MPTYGPRGVISGCSTRAKRGEPVSQWDSFFHICIEMSLFVCPNDRLCSLYFFLCPYTRESTYMCIQSYTLHVPDYRHPSVAPLFRIRDILLSARREANSQKSDPFSMSKSVRLIFFEYRKALAAGYLFTPMELLTFCKSVFMIGRAITLKLGLYFWNQLPLDPAGAEVYPRVIFFSELRRNDVLVLFSSIKLWIGC